MKKETYYPQFTNVYQNGTLYPVCDKVARNTLVGKQDLLSAGPGIILAEPSKNTYDEHLYDVQPISTSGYGLKQVNDYSEEVLHDAGDPRNPVSEITHEVSGVAYGEILMLLEDINEDGSLNRHYTDIPK